jgi:hypothetical protein
VCYGFEGEKRYISWFRSYLLIASMETQVQRRTTISVFDLKNRFIAFSLLLPGMTSAAPSRPSRGPSAMLTASGRETTLSRVGGGGGAGEASLSGQRMQLARHIVCEFGAIFVVSSSLQVYKLVEKDTATKLQRLFQIKAFDIAISVAHSSNYDVANIMDIYRMYGDSEYENKDFDRAIQQYISTIGCV